MKKIILGLGILAISSSAFAIGGSMTGSASTDIDMPGGLSGSVGVSSEKNDHVVCPMDAKKCPDGSFVGRVAPNCEFKACPKVKVEHKNETKVKAKTKTEVKAKATVTTGTATVKGESSEEMKIKSVGIGTIDEDEEHSIDTETGGNIMGISIDGVAPVSVDVNGNVDNSENNLMVSFSSDSNGKIKTTGKGNFDFKSGVKVNNNLVKVTTNIDGGDEIKISGKKHSVVVNLGSTEDVKIESGLIKIGSTEMSINIDSAIEKAVASSDADVVVSSEIKSDDDKKAYLEVKTQKKMKFLGLFDFNLDTEVKIDIKTGKVVEVDKPWYSFLVF